MIALRPDLAIIAAQVTPGARVIDIGCGDGDLMVALRDDKQVDVRGVELDPANVAHAVGRGLSVVQGDVDTDLDQYPDNSFDFAILSQTLQTARAPDRVLQTLLRIAPRAFVSFPNFAHWRMRTALLLGGRMPVTRALPLPWHQTENIRQLTIDDFRAFAAEQRIVIERAWYLSGTRLVSAPMANLCSEFGIFLLRRA